MDYYQLLRVSSQASTKEIEEAYQRLIKESRYDATIDLRDVHNAYRILSDPKHKAAYDNLVRAKEDRNTAYTATVKRKRKIPRQWKVNRKQLLLALLVLLIITAGYYAFRFGYVLKNFTEGDVLYINDTNQRVGVVLRHEIEHNFGAFHESAYLIHTDHGDVWYPATQLKMRCHKASSD
jgi:curved DNA-binding protein CbpA